MEEWLKAKVLLSSHWKVVETMPNMLAFVSQIYDFCLYKLTFKAGEHRFIEREFCSTHMRVTPSIPLQALKTSDLLGFLADYG